MHVEWPCILCCCLVINAFPPEELIQAPAIREMAVAGSWKGTDTAVPDLSGVRMEDYLRARLGEDSRLYNGREYIRNGTPAIGFPNFQRDSLQQGTLLYDGIFYAAIPLEYDLLQDQLVTPDRNSNLLIGLVPSKTSMFSIGAARFRYFGSGSQLSEPGFYQELFAGSAATLLARKQKVLVHPSSQDGQVRYHEIDTYYLVIGEVVHQVANQRDLMRALPGKKDDLKRFIRRNHLSFKDRFEASLVQTMAYYQQINP